MSEKVILESIDSWNNIQNIIHEIGLGDRKSFIIGTYKGSKVFVPGISFIKTNAFLIKDVNKFKNKNGESEAEYITVKSSDFKKDFKEEEKTIARYVFGSKKGKLVGVFTLLKAMKSLPLGQYKIEIDPNTKKGKITRIK